MLDRDWYTLCGEPVNLKRAIMDATEGDGKSIIIGTDSQRFDHHEDFITVIVVRTEMKGARVFFTKERDLKYYTLRDKLIKEAYMSIQTAYELSPILPPSCQICALHADVNTDFNKGKSAKYANEIAGLIIGSGFPVILKPNSWASSHVAEHVLKKISHDLYNPNL